MGARNLPALREVSLDADPVLAYIIGQLGHVLARPERADMRSHPAQVLLLVAGVLLFAIFRAQADPPLPLPRVPVCGDDDGSEPQVSFNCPELISVPDVQMFRVRGTGPVQLRFDFVFRHATLNNEFGFFLVDDEAATIEGLLPGAPGYLARALARAVIIFPSGSNASTEDVTRTFNGGDILVFFIVSDSTLAQLLKNNPDNRQDARPVAFFSLDVLNPDVFDHLVGFENAVAVPAYSQLGFEDLLRASSDLDWDDVVCDIVPPLEPLPNELTLTPTAASLMLSETHNLTATARELGGSPIPGLPVTFIVAGVNPGAVSNVTDDAGQAGFSYSGLHQGRDFIVATAQITGKYRRSNMATACWACCATDGDCDDGNVCTDDSCLADGTCVYANNEEPCDDGDTCTQTDACQAGHCVGSNPVICTLLSYTTPSSRRRPQITIRKIADARSSGTGARTTTNPGPRWLTTPCC